MFKNVKSFYFLRIIFSFVDEKQKLELIKYNKSLQEIINITIINYKFFSEKYIEYEPNGKGKEFYSLYDKLIFEGEYLNGKRNGKGKEYDFLNGDLIFEGEYLSGKRNGKGKEYNKYGRLIFEGEYLYNNKYNGKGYDEDGNIIYELINGNGKVQEYDFDHRLTYEGDYLNGKRHGKGKEYFYHKRPQLYKLTFLR